MKKFIEWNEKMFIKYNNERVYRHPNPFIRFIEEERVRLIIKELKYAEKTLDAGCGEGFILRRILSPIRVGLDISCTALRRAAVDDQNSILVRGDVSDMPFSGSYFDAAVCSETLEHIPEPKKAVRELSRIVKPGGIIILSVPNENLINRIKDLVWNLGLFNVLFPDIPRRQNEEWHLHSFDLSMLREVTSDFVEVKKIYKIPFFFLPIRYLAVCRNQKDGPRQSNKLFPKQLKNNGVFLDSIE
jgi:ubiquinone/menaquinone biosynthesis C-methylase UbiE